MTFGRSARIQMILNQNRIEMGITVLLTYLA
jgi:hypothetical protein